MSSGPEEVFCAELGVQTETDASFDFLSTSLSLSPKEVITVDQGVQTVNISVQAIQFFQDKSMQLPIVLILLRANLKHQVMWKGIGLKSVT